MDKKIKPIIIAGYLLIGVTCIGLLFFYWISKQNSLNDFLKYFILSLSIFYLITGIGVINLTRWGYYLFKTFLYMLVFSFPIGTVIAYITLSYMKKHNIREYFFAYD